jgi:predicted nucleic acid-binding protein
MSTSKGLILDANILLRAVFGIRVMWLLEEYEDAVDFYSPDVCFSEAETYIPELAKKRRLDLELAREILAKIEGIVQPVERSLYEDYESVARERIGRRDPHDWPVVAAALLLNLPVWTEDQDFFGTGIPTWTTDRVELYLRDSK